MGYQYKIATTPSRYAVGKGWEDDAKVDKCPNALNLVNRSTKHNRIGEGGSKAGIFMYVFYGWSLSPSFLPAKRALG